MSAAARLAAAALALALAACGQQGAETRAAGNGAEAVANADVETLPADESAATPSGELANGAAEPQGNTADIEP